MNKPPIANLIVGQSKIYGRERQFRRYGRNSRDAVQLFYGCPSAFMFHLCSWKLSCFLTVACGVPPRAQLLRQPLRAVANRLPALFQSHAGGGSFDREKFDAGGFKRNLHRRHKTVGNRTAFKLKIVYSGET